MCLDAPETCGDTSSDIIRQDRQVDKLATARRSVTKIKMMMVRMIGGKKERSENTTLAKMEADTLDTALVNNIKDADNYKPN